MIDGFVLITWAGQNEGQHLTLDLVQTDGHSLLERPSTQFPLEARDDGSLQKLSLLNTSQTSNSSGARIPPKGTPQSSSGPDPIFTNPSTILNNVKYVSFFSLLDNSISFLPFHERHGIDEPADNGVFKMVKQRYFTYDVFRDLFFRVACLCQQLSKIFLIYLPE